MHNMKNPNKDDDHDNNNNNNAHNDCDNDNDDDKYGKRHKQIKQGVSIVCMLFCCSTIILLLLIVLWGQEGPIPRIPLPSHFRHADYSPTYHDNIGSHLRDILSQHGQFLLRRPLKHVEVVLLEQNHLHRPSQKSGRTRDTVAHDKISKKTIDAVDDDGHLEHNLTAQKRRKEQNQDTPHDKH